jgi:hypothetical protein
LEIDWRLEGRPEAVELRSLFVDYSRVHVEDLVIGNFGRRDDGSRLRWVWEGGHVLPRTWSVWELFESLVA